MNLAICNLIVNGFWFIIGVFLSSIILIPFEDTLLQSLRNYWLLLQKRVVKGTAIKCNVYPHMDSIENAYLISQITFKVNSPYKNMSEDYMDIKESDRIIMKAILNKCGIDLQKSNYKLNNIMPSYNVFIRKDELDYR